MIKPKKALDNITPYKTDKYKSSWKYKLDSNENIYGCSNFVIDAIRNFNCEDVSLYPTYGKLIEKLSSRYNLDEDCFLISNGCDEALNIIESSYLEENDEILSFSPSFSMPALYANINGAKAKFVDYEDKFVFNPQKLQENISDRTKIIYIASPNNPTGEIAPKHEVEELIKNNQNILFIIDCTYINFSYSAIFEEYLELIKYDNVAVVKSFSKDFGLAGLRLGFAAAKKEIIENLKKVSSPYSVNIIAAKCALAALGNEEEFNEIKELNKIAREELFNGLIEAGFKPYKSEGNFILCDFYSKSDFYYEKLKKNGIIVRKFSPDSKIPTCLRITIPTLDGVKIILDLLKTKDLLIFDLDGVVFDVSESYLSAIKETFKHFSGYEVELKEILEVKNLGGMNCDWDATKCLLERRGFNIALDDIINVFQDLFYNPDIKKDNYLIDKERLLISKEAFREISKKYDLAVFSGRLRVEAKYSLEKYGIDKYFYYFVTADDLPQGKSKPDPMGVNQIKEHCPYKTIKYLGDSVDDMIAGNKAEVDTIGVISPEADYNSMKNNFKHLGAKFIISDIASIVDFLKEIDNDK